MTDHSGWAVRVPEGYRVGPWRIGTPLASGCWGSVYAAERVDGDGPTTAACKFLPGNALTPAQRSTVEDLASRERAFGATVRSEHLIRTYDVCSVVDERDATLDGCTVIVMERARASMRDVLEGATGSGAVPDAVSMLEGLAAALDDVHRAGWVHGDVSASNVLVMDDGSVRLADFGLSAELEGTHAYIPQLGSFDYTPAEWWSSPVDDRGIEARPSRDIWAFGVLAHRLLSGRHPFPGCDPRTRATAVREYAATGDGLHLHPALAGPWRDLISACLDADADTRGHLAGTLARRVRELADTPIEADVATAERHDPRTRTLRWHIAVGLAAATVAAVAAAAASALVSNGGLSAPSSDDSPAAVTDGPPASPKHGGEIADDSAVPVRYRGMITKMAHRCPDSVVTPSFLAAVVAAESGFNPHKRSPETNEYGIAMWTPWVFDFWAKTKRYPQRSYFNARDSVRALSDYVCWAGKALENVPLDDPVYRAVAYRTSDATVSEYGGIPPEYRDYAAEVRRNLRAFTETS